MTVVAIKKKLDLSHLKDELAQADFDFKRLQNQNQFKSSRLCLDLLTSPPEGSRVLRKVESQKETLKKNNVI